MSPRLLAICPQALENTSEATGVAGTIAETQLLIQLSEVCFGLQDMPQGQEVLVRAKGVQEKVLQELKQSTDALRKEKTRVRAGLHYHLIAVLMTRVLTRSDVCVLYSYCGPTS